MFRTMSQIMRYAFSTLRQRSWWGGPDTFEQQPKVNFKAQLSPRQKQACNHKPPTFRNRGRSK